MIKLLLVGSLLLGGVACAQDSDPASPHSANAQRGRDLLAVLGPRPSTPGGLSPLQEQELGRRVRCAATRQQIQDELDVEAAGSVGFYVLSELRFIEKENCAPVPLLAGMQTGAAPAPVQAGTWQPPAQLTQAPPPAPVATPAPTHPAPPSQQASHPVATPPASAAAPPRPVAQAPGGPAFTPAPDYPKAEMDAGHQGVVMVQLVMNADGSVKDATVAKSSNYPVLDASALTAAKTWRIPAAAGRTINVPLTFSAH